MNIDEACETIWDKSRAEDLRAEHSRSRLMRNLLTVSNNAKITHEPWWSQWCQGRLQAWCRSEDGQKYLVRCGKSIDAEVLEAAHEEALSEHKERLRKEEDFQKKVVPLLGPGMAKVLGLIRQDDEPRVSAMTFSFVELDGAVVISKADFPRLVEARTRHATRRNFRKNQKMDPLEDLMPRLRLKIIERKAPRMAGVLRRRKTRTAMENLVLCLFDAQKWSDAAKATSANGKHYYSYISNYAHMPPTYAAGNYRRSRKAREKRYSKKEEAILLACRYAAEAGVRFGYRNETTKYDPFRAWPNPIHRVIYFDLPTGQCSFHTLVGNVPQYPGTWSGLTNSRQVINLAMYSQVKLGAA